MRKTIMLMLLGSMLAPPALAQTVGERWRETREARENRDEIRRDRREVRDSAREVEDSRREVREAVRSGDMREAREDMRDLRRDKAELQRDRAELRQGRREAGRDRQEWRNDRRDDRREAWRRDWRYDDRYDWQRWRNQHRDRYHVPRYSAPRYHSYRRWHVGIRIDPFFYGNRYWINEPWEYRLPPAYGPYRWVRYYDDVMLIDMRTGRIADIIYNFFW